MKLADLLKGPAEAWRLFPGVSLAAFAQFLVEGKVSDDFKNRMVDWRSWKGSFNEFMWPAMDACLLQVLVRGVTTTDDYASVVARIANRKKTATHHMLASGYHRLLQACVGGDDARIVAGVDEIASQWAERSTRRDFQVDNLAHEGPGEWNAHVVDFRCAAILKAFDRTAFVITARPDFPHVWRGGFQRDGRTS